MSKKLLGLLTAFILGFSILVPLSYAANEGIVDTTSAAQNTAKVSNKCVTKYDCGDYSLNDMVAIAIRAANWILGIVGSITLLMFVYGGFLFLTSSGSSEQIKKAKSVLVAAVIGLIIVFSSYLIIKFILGQMGVNFQPQVGQNSVITQNIA